MLALTTSWTYVAGVYSIGYRGEHLRALTVVPLTAVVALMIWFGLDNHRTAAQGYGRIARQVLSATTATASLSFTTLTPPRLPLRPLSSTEATVPPTTGHEMMAA